MKLVGWPTENIDFRSNKTSFCYSAALPAHFLCSQYRGFCLAGTKRHKLEADHSTNLVLKHVLEGVRRGEFGPGIAPQAGQSRVRLSTASLIFH